MAPRRLVAAGGGLGVLFLVAYLWYRHALGLHAETFVVAGSGYAADAVGVWHRGVR